jgi:hypothetical protein
MPENQKNGAVVNLYAGMLSAGMQLCRRLVVTRRAPEVLLSQEAIRKQQADNCERVNELTGISSLISKLQAMRKQQAIVIEIT